MSSKTHGKRKKSGKKRGDARRVQNIAHAVQTAGTGAASLKLVSADEFSLLENVATALNALSAFGVDVRLRHDAVITELGYVFWINSDDRPWSARSLQVAEFTPPPLQYDEE